MINSYRIFAVCCALLLLVQCGLITSDDRDENNGKASVKKKVYGAFKVILRPPQGTAPGYTFVHGRILDNPVPEAVIWEEVAASGDCRLFTPRMPICEVICGETAVCVEDGSCQSDPNAISVGIVTVEGLRTTDGETTFKLEPITNKYIYEHPSVKLAYPAFSEGDVITVFASGDSAISAFMMTVRGISPLEILNDTIRLIDGQPINLKWTPPGQMHSVISVTVNISPNWGTKGWIECEAMDDGLLEIPSSLLDKLKALGVSGYPEINITRRVIDTSKSVPIELIIESGVHKYIKIPGLITCTGDDDCPEQQTCGLWDMKCQ